MLTGRTILLISPQPWDHIFISKHHYASELGQTNDVFFLEPPVDGEGAGLDFRPAPGAQGVTLVSWRPGFPRRIRFHAYWLYRWLIAREARRIASSLGRAPDVVWCFDFNLFPDLGAFGAPLTIFHPVDPLSSRRQADIGLTADLIVSVSERILRNFADARFRGRTLLVNHGLASSFARLADEPAAPGNGRQVGFFGNLDRRFINVRLLLRLAEAHREITFHFWGPCEASGLFRTVLASEPNVRLHGRVDKDALAVQAATMDAFILPYREDAQESDRSNSHKLLEYMSTGKITVACPLDCYADAPDLVRMPASDDDEAFMALFAETMGEIDTWNAPARCARRKAFAKDFSYAQNIARIERVLTERSGAATAICAGALS